MKQKHKRPVSVDCREMVRWAIDHYIVDEFNNTFEVWKDYERIVERLEMEMDPTLFAGHIALVAALNPDDPIK